MIEGHGDDAWKYHSPIKADFSSNVLYGPLDAGLLGHLRDQMGAITHYPEAGAQSLRRAAVSVLRHAPGNVIVLRSLTKSCRIPGLRVGFVIGAAALITRLRDGKMPWSVNRPAIEAGLYIFAHPQEFKVPVQQLRAETVAWQHDLRAALAGWKVWDTDTHYFLIEAPAEWPARALKNRLVERYGLLVRDASNFRNLRHNAIRVACQSPEHNQLLTEALGECAGGAG
ncbi:MAG TPA: aminotransferase class I/II-fold pyridoxal phosphate-dependent enzyme [Puia sp.]|nr:aminotransferase class I/II-fold pyridoxal phosphate-dependent enzyme [Puia sp.]